MDVMPATIAQVRAARDGRTIIVPATESHVATELDRLGAICGFAFLLCWHEETDHWSIRQRTGPAEDDEQLIATTQHADYLPLVVADLERRINRRYSLADELNALDDQSERDRDKALEERVGEASQVAWHEMRRQAGVTNRIFIPHGSARTPSWPASPQGDPS